MYEGLALRRLRVVDGGDSHVARWTGEVRVIHGQLREPLTWRKPEIIFVNSMSDVFHTGFSDDDIDMVFGVMAACEYRGNAAGDAFRWHTFHVLTKRADRMRAYLAQDRRERWAKWAVNYGGGGDPDGLYDGIASGPRELPHVWLGVSVEDQERADERIPDLLATRAAVRFLSCEPLIGPVDLKMEWLLPFHDHDPMLNRTPRIDWVIAGCESGDARRRRRCDVDWLRDLRDRCGEAGVPFYLKQAMGSQGWAVHTGPDAPAIAPGPGSKRKATGPIELPYLDGVKHDGMPPVLT